MRNVVYYKKHNIMVYSQNPENAQQVTAKIIAATCLFIENIQLSCFYSEIFFCSFLSWINLARYTAGVSSRLVKM